MVLAAVVILELAGPLATQFALRRAGEAEPEASVTVLEFKRSEPLTLGVELELQILNTRDFNLTRGASDLLAR